LPADVHHAARGLLETGLANMVARLFFADDGMDVGDELGIGVAGAHAPGKAVIEDGEKTGTDLSVGGDANPAAMSAERMRHRGDDADLAAAVIELEAARCLAALVFDLDQRPELVHLTQNLVQRDHHLRRPYPVFLERHEFYEA